MYRNFIQGYREAIPSGLPARLADPDLIAAGKPTFLRIGEGNEPRNELLRVVKQYPSKDEVRTKVLGEIFPPTDTDPYFARPDNIAAIRTASEQLGIPLERTGLRIATHPFRLEGNVADVNLLADITKQAAINLQKQGSPVLANALTRKAQFFNQPRSYRELAIDGSEGIDSIIAAYEKAEPRVTANSQGNRPILMQADGLDPNIGIPSGSPKNIPPMDIEGMRGANRFVDVSQGAETARVIQYPNIYDRINKGAQPVVTPTIPYAADLPTGQEFILSPKVSIETKRPRFIDMGYGIYTRSGEPINAEQKNLLDMGMADLEDRSFILRDPASVNQLPIRALASRLPEAYYSYPRDIPTEGRAAKGQIGTRGTNLSATVTREDLPLTGEIGTAIGFRLNPNEQRQSKRLGLEILGIEKPNLSILTIPEKYKYVVEQGTIPKELWGTVVEVPTDYQVLKRYVDKPKEFKNIFTSDPVRRLATSTSDNILADPNYLKQFEPFKSNRNTYGAREGKTPWREYYSDPFVYEDKGIDNEVNRLIKAVNEAPAQLENAYTQQASANRRASDIQDTINVVRRMGRGTTTPQSDVFSLGVSPELIVKPTSLFNSLKKDRRMAEVEASKAADRIAELKAAQELMGIEYMAKPKVFSPEVLQGYRMASQNKGAIKNQETFDYPSGTVLDPVDYEKAMTDMGFVGSRDLWRDEPEKDYDIASLFGFSGNY